MYGTTADAGLDTSYTVAGLAPGTYYFAVKAYDTSGLESAYSNEVVHLIPGEDTAAPALFGISASSITSSSALITWATDEPASSQVQYGITQSYGSSTVLDGDLVTSHSQVLPGLVAGRLYHYRVLSADAAGNQALSPDLTFTTAQAGDTTPPDVSVNSPSQGATVAGTITITAAASDASGISGVQFLLNGEALGAEVVQAPYTYSWNTLAAANGSHVLSAAARDDAGNTAASPGVTVFVSNADDTSGLEAAYGFEEGSGSTAADDSGNSNTAALYGAKWSSGAFGGGLVFNGASYYARAGTAGLPATNAAKTISWWMAAGPRAAGTAVALSNQSLGAGVHCGIRDSLAGVWSAGGISLVSAPLPPSPGAWHYYAYAFDGTSHSLYVDGELVASSTAPVQAATVTDFELGRSPGGTGYLHALLDEVRIYSRSLSQAEIGADMGAPVGSPRVSPTGTTSFPTGMEESAPSPGASRPSAPDEVSVDVQLERAAFVPGETLSAPVVHISNTGGVERRVELKSWLSVEGQAPFVIGAAGADGSLVLAAGMAREFGPVRVMTLDPALPQGTYSLNVRLLDYVTGESLSEDLNPFVLGRASPSTIAASARIAPRLALHRNESGACCALWNAGDSPVVVEVKMWLETPGWARLPLLSAGADSSLVVRPHSALDLAPLLLPTQAGIPAGVHAFHVRILDPSTGQVLLEQSAPAEVP